MKLEVDKYYKTRDGRKVHILQMDKDSFIGTIEKDGILRIWQNDGTNSWLNSDADLVSEWPKSVKKIYAWIIRNSMVQFTESPEKPPTFPNICSRASWLDGEIEVVE